MLIKRYIAIIIGILFLLPDAMGQQKRDSLVVSLLTCWPGAEVYELCGHEAVRIKGESFDSVWNYGAFDFQQPNFIYRFVKGETDYMVVGYPTFLFMNEYRSQGRKVVEQKLNLTQAEAAKLRAMLQENALPQNCTYRYNYVKDNCATRITSMLDKASDRRIVYPDSVKYGTFRNAMRHYHRNYPWYQFGIDLALGSGIDYPITGREEMFIPLEMMEKTAGAHFEDGEPLARPAEVLYEGTEGATLGPTHWSATPVTCCWAFCLMVFVTCWLQFRRKTIYRTVYSIWFTILGLTGCVVTFLVFVSEHEATTPNILLLWLNPLQFVIAAGVWFGKKIRAATIAMSYVNILVLTILLIVWPMQAQSANPAFFPLMLATLALSADYAIIKSKPSYINSHNISINEEVSNLGARRSGHSGRGRTNRRKPAKVSGRNSR